MEICGTNICMGRSLIPLFGVLEKNNWRAREREREREREGGGGEKKSLIVDHAYE